MYRQISVDPRHTPFQRILFRNSDGHINDFELRTVTFGFNCAPSLAMPVAGSWQLTSNVIRHLMYVDKVLSEADSAEDGKVLFIPRAFHWENEILAHIQSDHLLSTDFLKIDTMDFLPYGVPRRASRTLWRLARSIRCCDVCAHREDTYDYGALAHGQYACGANQNGVTS